MRQLAFRSMMLNETDVDVEDSLDSVESMETLPTTFDVSDASSTWVFMVAISTLAAAFICPILGAVADRYHARKMIVYVTSALSILFATLFALQPDDTDWYWILFVIGIAMMFTSVMHCFYNSLLMICCESDELVKVACMQTVVGGVGAAVLMLLLGMAHVSKSELTRDYVITAYLGAALWFFIFAIPMWLWLHEPTPEETKPESIDQEMTRAWKETVKSMGVRPLREVLREVNDRRVQGREGGRGPETQRAAADPARPPQGTWS